MLHRLPPVAACITADACWISTHTCSTAQHSATYRRLRWVLCSQRAFLSNACGAPEIALSLAALPQLHVVAQCQSPTQPDTAVHASLYCLLRLPSRTRLVCCPCRPFSYTPFLLPLPLSDSLPYLIIDHQHGRGPPCSHQVDNSICHGIQVQLPGQLLRLNLQAPQHKTHLSTAHTHHAGRCVCSKAAPLPIAFGRACLWCAKPGAAGLTRNAVNRPHLGDSCCVDLRAEVLQAVFGRLEGLAAADEACVTHVQPRVQLLPVGWLQEVCQALVLGMQGRVAGWGDDVEAGQRRRFWGVAVAASSGGHDCCCWRWWRCCCWCLWWPHKNMGRICWFGCVAAYEQSKTGKKNQEINLQIRSCSCFLTAVASCREQLAL